jgi:hypothetical protein
MPERRGSQGTMEGENQALRSTAARLNERASKVVTALATATIAASCGDPSREYGKSEPAPRPAVHRVAAASGHAPSAGATGSSASDLRRASLAAAGDIACPRRPCPPQRRTARLVRRLDPTAVLTLGDNQYDSGSLRDFRRSYRPTWGAFREKTHPAPGNHDYETTGARGYFRFFGAAAHGPGGFYAFRIRTWRLFALNTENRGLTRRGGFGGSCATMTTAASSTIGTRASMVIRDQSRRKLSGGRMVEDPLPSRRRCRVERP